MLVRRFSFVYFHRILLFVVQHVIRLIRVVLSMLRIYRYWLFPISSGIRLLFTASTGHHNSKYVPGFRSISIFSELTLHSRGTILRIHIKAYKHVDINNPDLAVQASWHCQREWRCVPVCSIIIYLLAVPCLLDCCRLVIWLVFFQAIATSLLKPYPPLLCMWLHSQIGQMLAMATLIDCFPYWFLRRLYGSRYFITSILSTIWKSEFDHVVAVWCDEYYLSLPNKREQNPKPSTFQIQLFLLYKALLPIPFKNTYVFFGLASASRREIGMWRYHSVYFFWLYG